MACFKLVANIKLGSSLKKLSMLAQDYVQHFLEIYAYLTITYGYINACSLRLLNYR